RAQARRGGMARTRGGFRHSQLSDYSDSPAPMIKQDEELDKLEEDIRKLKNKYDQFFTGITKVPPSIDRHKVESMIHEMNKQKMRDNGRRFRFNTITARFNQFREMWARRMRELEEGPVDFRRRQAAMTAPIEPPPPLAAPPRVT